MHAWLPVPFKFCTWTLEHKIKLMPFSFFLNQQKLKLMAFMGTNIVHCMHLSIGNKNGGGTLPGQKLSWASSKPRDLDQAHNVSFWVQDSVPASKRLLYICFNKNFQVSCWSLLISVYIYLRISLLYYSATFSGVIMGYDVSEFSSNPIIYMLISDNILVKNHSDLRE